METNVSPALQSIWKGAQDAVRMETDANVIAMF